MITLPQVKAAVITKLESSTAVTDLLVDVNGVAHPEEIRELEWRGTKFTYPNIRVRVEKFVPQNPNCASANCTIGIYVFGENYSSKKIDEIASQCLLLFHGNSFSVPSGVRFSSVSGEQMGADAIEESAVWVGVVRVTCLAS